MKAAILGSAKALSLSHPKPVLEKPMTGVWVERLEKEQVDLKNQVTQVEHAG